jgi:ATP-dependent Lon protease
MPITLSTIPKKTTTTKKTKKQEDATRTYKSNLNGPGPGQPPSPESDATDNEESIPTTPNATNENQTTSNAQPSNAQPSNAQPSNAQPSNAQPKKKMTKKMAQQQQRLEVNRLLAELYPSNHMTQKVAALEALSEMVSSETEPEPEKPKPKGRKKTSPLITETQDPVANAIIDSAFNDASLKTPPASPPPVSVPIPNAPKKVSKTKETSGSKMQSKNQKYNIIIHVEPTPSTSPGLKDPKDPKDDDISKRLDFGNAKKEPKATTTKKSKKMVHDSDDNSDEDYVPGSSEDDDGTSWSTYDEDEYDDYDDEYDENDDSYYSSTDSSDDDDDDNDDAMAEIERLQESHMEEMKMLQSLRSTYESLLSKDKNNRVVAKQLKTLKESEEKIKQELDELTHTQKRRNSKKFRKLLRRKSSTNDLDYFKKHLTIQQQRALIDEMTAVANVTAIEKPYKLTLLESDIPRDMKAVALRKVGMLQYMEPGCGEYCKLKNWVDAFMQIPFNKNKNLPITMSDGVDKCHEFMTNAKISLDKAVYGLTDAKMQIMQMVGQWIANPAAIGTAVAIHGPPGTGKTSLVKEGISKILGRDFAFIALGGATDSSFLEGHSYTYEGSMWGKIVDILIRCKSSNPVIYFDELDKISETSKGEEIAGILTHLTDTSQNSQFHDKYFSEVAFDLSKCLFIFSYNDESRVNPVLLDRMYKIRTTGYSTKDKTFIAQHHLIPRIRAEVAFAEGDIVIPDAVVEHIVEHHTNKEAGVRNLKRCLETIYTKLNLHRLMRPGTQLFDEKEKSFEVSFPYTVNTDVVDRLVKKNDADRPNLNMYL